MVRFWISLITVFAGVFLTNMISGGNVSNLLNVFSFIIGGVFPIIFVCILFGFKEICFSFSVLSKKVTEKEELLKALHFFKIYGKTIWVTGIIAIIVILVSMLTYLEDKSGLGPNLHTALITILYCGVTYIGIIIPYSVCIKKQIG